ncbi:hypothetical protein GE09DRAFT_486540 [Coniochaeta sp. 2T2.1]|nr:hypothetical protein GE09DRAFT_486540 [Coniochaeta sp. 2T2.1]
MKKRMASEVRPWVGSSPGSALVDLYAEILSFLSYALSNMEKSTARRTYHAIFRPGVFGEYVSKLEHLEQRAERCMSICARFMDRLEHQGLREDLLRIGDALCAPVSRLDSRLGELLCLTESVERCRTLQWISTVHHETDDYNAQKGRLQGTADWLLARKEFVEWRNSPASAIFWLHGIRMLILGTMFHIPLASADAYSLAGAGKTKLSSKVVDDVRSRLSDPEDQETLAHFYCDANRSSHKTALAILRSLVKQLSAPIRKVYDNCIISAVADMYRSNSNLRALHQTDSLLRLPESAARSYRLLPAGYSCD